MGLAGLTAVFGMGTGVTPPVWSPEMRPAGDQAGPGACATLRLDRRQPRPSWAVFVIYHPASRARQAGLAEALGNGSPTFSATVLRRTDRGGQAIGC